MFIKYKYVDSTNENPNTIYLEIKDIEINMSLDSCVVHMPYEYCALVYGDDITTLIDAFERNDYIFNFNALSESAEFFNKYGDKLEKFTGEVN